MRYHTAVPALPLPRRVCMGKEGDIVGTMNLALYEIIAQCQITYQSINQLVVSSHCTTLPISPNYAAV